MSHPQRRALAYQVTAETHKTSKGYSPYICLGGIGCMYGLSCFRNDISPMKYAAFRLIYTYKRNYV